MTDVLAIIFAAIGLCFGAALLTSAERFRVRSIKQRGIQKSDLRQTLWRLIKYSLIAFLAFFLWILIRVVADQGSSINDFDHMLFFCFVGPLLTSFSVLWGVLTVLKYVNGLPVLNGDEDRSAD